MSQAQQLIAGELATSATPCVTSSFQAECVVLVHMLREVRPDIPGSSSTPCTISRRRTSTATRSRSAGS